MMKKKHGGGDGSQQGGSQARRRFRERGFTRNQTSDYQQDHLDDDHHRHGDVGDNAKPNTGAKSFKYHQTKKITTL